MSEFQPPYEDSVDPIRWLLFDQGEQAPEALIEVPQFADEVDAQEIINLIRFCSTGEYEYEQALDGVLARAVNEAGAFTQDNMFLGTETKAAYTRSEGVTNYNQLHAELVLAGFDADEMVLAKERLLEHAIADGFLDEMILHLVVENGVSELSEQELADKFLA